MRSVKNVKKKLSVLGTILKEGVIQRNGFGYAIHAIDGYIHILH